MKPSFWRKLDTVARQLVPAVSIFAMLLASVVPLHVPYFEAVAPSLPLIAVFYWTLYRPDLMPAFAVFLLGLAQDILVGAPLGINACLLVLVHAAVRTQRRFFTGRSFGILWLGFASVAVLALPVGWLMACAYYGRLAPPDAVIFQTLTTIGCFPLLSWALLRCQLSLLKQA
jgi:rod shape-determining protein MreD